MKIAKLVNLSFFIGVSLISIIIFLTGCLNSPTPQPTYSPTPTTQPQITPTVAISTSNLATTTAVLGGNITSTGGQNATIRGFIYGLTTDYGSDIHESGSFGAGAFSLNVSGLAPNTIYHVKAYATNPQGTSYSTDSSFKTAFINSDYYYGFLNENGSLNFTNKTTGDVIVDNAPQYYCNYGAKTIADVSPLNPSVESATNGIPDGWTVDKTYIRQSAEQASSGTHSMKFNMTAADSDQRRAYSSLITIKAGKQYAISVDSYLSSFKSGTPRLLIIYYETADGRGKAYQSAPDLCYFPINTGVWNTSHVTWIPPFGALSFRLLLYSSDQDVAIVYVDNVVVNEETLTYQTNGNVKSTITVSGDDVVVTSRDDTNSDVVVANRYDLNTHSPNIKYTATLTYKNTVTTEEEKFVFTIPTQKATVMTRDYVLGAFNVTKGYYSDLYSPKVVKFDNGLSFLNQDTMQSMDLRADGIDSVLTFYSDYYLNHPAFYWIKNEYGEKVDTSRQKRTAGETYTSSVTLTIDTVTTRKSLVKTLQPNGYDATIVFTNHPDSESIAAINAVAYGTEDTSSPMYDTTKGLIPNGIKWTKGVFVSGQSGADLQNPTYKKLTDKLFGDGAEIFPHSITPDTDSRAVVNTGLTTLQNLYYSKVWIDHGPSNGLGNWEDISSQGALKGSDNYILDLLDNYGYKYYWAAGDLPKTNYNPNLKDPDVTDKITPFFFYNNQVDDNLTDKLKMYRFRAVETDNSADLYYSTAHIDTLISQKGVSISHDYFGIAANNNHTFYTNPATGKIEINPTFETELEYMAAKRASGQLWTPSMSELGDYLILLSNVEVTSNADGTYTVANNNTSSITGLTLLAEAAINSAFLDGKYLESFNGNKIVLPTLSAGQKSKIVIYISHL